jgi:hypothetical protein
VVKVPRMWTHLSHVGEFIWAVVVAWRNLAAVAVFCLFSFPNAILSDQHRAKYEKSWPSDRRRKWLMRAAIAYLFVASFFAWDKERKVEGNAINEKNTAEMRSACLAKQLTVKKDRGYKKSQLQKFYASGQIILYENIPKNSSAAAFDAYEAEFNSWKAETSNWIVKNLGEAALARFNDYGNPLPMIWDRAAGPDQNNIINALVAFSKNLSELIQSDTWDDLAAIETCP